LEIWSQHRREIDLLLTDMMMPEGMSGRELTEKILRDEPRLRVMFTSGYPLEALGADLAQSGHCFLQKPYSPAALARAVRDCLDSAANRTRLKKETAHADVN
jgi:CheY-like chemotaxis protein